VVVRNFLRFARTGLRRWDAPMNQGTHVPHNCRHDDNLDREMGNIMPTLPILTTLHRAEFPDGYATVLLLIENAGDAQ
jgi:hypothetical protein